MSASGDILVLLCFGKSVESSSEYGQKLSSHHVHNLSKFINYVHICQ